MGVGLHVYALDADRVMSVGNTFCTIEQFDTVVRAIAEFAFVISELPVVLSMEVTLGLQFTNCLLLTSDWAVLLLNMSEPLPSVADAL